MKYISLILLFLLLSNLSSCIALNSLLGLNKCAYSGCDRQALEDCHYCGFHCETHYLPADFNSRVGKSIDEQVKKSQKPIKMK